MAVDDPADLLTVCTAYLDEQRRLLTMLQHCGNPERIALAMQVQLDQFAEAVRQAQPDRVRARHEPGS